MNATWPNRIASTMRSGKFFIMENVEKTEQKKRVSIFVFTLYSVRIYGMDIVKIKSFELYVLGLKPKSFTNESRESKPVLTILPSCNFTFKHLYRESIYRKIKESTFSI